MLNEIDLSRTDLNLFVVFEAVMEARHVGRAATRLSLSPSAVSHALGRLRALLDDPVFLRTPKGVTPTDRAMQLAPAIADVLSRARSVVASASPFDPARSDRRFRLGAPDGVSAVFLPRLLAQLRRTAPGVAISIAQLLPEPGEPLPGLAWRSALRELETGKIDAAVLPFDDVPVRFTAQTLYEEEFVIAMRAGHPLRRKMTLPSYCAADHLVVSESGDPHGFVDDLLARRGGSRRVALTAPNYMFALALLAETDLVSAVPRRLAALHAPRFGLAWVEAPIPLPRFSLRLVTPTVALNDAGLAWLVAVLLGCSADDGGVATPG